MWGGDASQRYMNQGESPREAVLRGFAEMGLRGLLIGIVFIAASLLFKKKSKEVGLLEEEIAEEEDDFEEEAMSVNKAPTNGWVQKTIRFIIGARYYLYIIALIILIVVGVYALKPLVFSIRTHTTNVYVCPNTMEMNRWTHVYHKDPTCATLQHCTSDIMYISEDEAITKYHRKPCPVCIK
jgi:hypothetical protein